MTIDGVSAKMRPDDSSGRLIDHASLPIDHVELIEKVWDRILANFIRVLDAYRQPLHSIHWCLVFDDQIAHSLGKYLYTYIISLRHPAAR